MNPPLPPVAVTAMEPVASPLHRMFVPVGVMVMAEGCVTVAVVVPVHPEASFTTMEYAAALMLLKLPVA